MIRLNEPMTPPMSKPSIPARVEQVGFPSRFWGLYALAWLPYASGLAALFIYNGGNVWLCVISGCCYAVPAALLGVFVLLFSRRTMQLGTIPVWHVGVHLIFGVAFAWITTMTAVILMSLRSSWSSGHFVIGHLPAPALKFHIVTSATLYGVLVGVVYVRQVTLKFDDERTRRIQAETSRAQAELQALRAQINPHFLFNTLHSLMALVREDSQAAEDALEQFAGLLRYALRVHKDSLEEVPLREEWMFVSDYLALEQLRLGDRLRLETDLDPQALECLVPAFCLQPIVENAVRHGIAPRSSVGRLTIRAHCNEDLVLQVRDDGPGAMPSAFNQSQGLGVRTVRQRLSALYGESAGVTAEKPVDGGFAVSIHIPIQREFAVERREIA
jgi:signal transduction histidine kinase